MITRSNSRILLRNIKNESFPAKPEHLLTTMCFADEKTALAASHRTCKNYVRKKYREYIDNQQNY